MRLRLAAFRIASALLLMSVAADMIGVDILEQALHQAQSVQKPSCPDNGVSDDCFCCCAHVVLTPPVHLFRLMGATYLEHSDARPPSVIDPAPPYHPPRA
jgi:hypothetical protein